MNNENRLIVFENKNIRRVWHKQEWFYSVIDVVFVLTDSLNYQTARNYWKVLKHRLIKEGNQLVTICNQLRLIASDGKMRLTDCADTKELLNIINSLKSVG